MESATESLFPLSYLELPVRCTWWTTFGQKIEAVGLYSGAVLYEMCIRLSVRLSKVRNAYSERPKESGTLRLISPISFSFWSSSHLSWTEKKSLLPTWNASSWHPSGSIQWTCVGTLYCGTCFLGVGFRKPNNSIGFHCSSGRTLAVEDIRTSWTT